MIKRKRAGWLCTAIASLGSILSSGCYSNRSMVSVDNVRFGYGLVGLGAFFLYYAPTQEDQGGRDLATGLGVTGLVLGGTLLVSEYAISSPRYGLSEEEISKRLSYLNSLRTDF